MHPPFVFKVDSGPKSFRTSSRCQRVWQWVIVLATLALALASETSWGAEAGVCESAFQDTAGAIAVEESQAEPAAIVPSLFTPAIHFPTTSELQRNKDWKVGDTISLQFAFTGFDRTSLENAAIRAELESAIAKEKQATQARREKLVEQWESHEKAAARAASLNPLRKWKGQAALEYQEGLNELIELGGVQEQRLGELSDIIRGKNRLTNDQVKKISTFVFSEQIKITKKSDILRITARQERLKLSLATFESTQVKSASLLARGVRLMKTKWGILGLGILGSFAVTGYELYSEAKSQQAEESYYLIYDDRVVAQ